MYRFLKRWFRSPSRPAQGRRERRPGSFRPGLETLEDRQLLSAAPVVNAMVNEDFFVDRSGRLQEIDHTVTNPFTGGFVKTTLDQSVRASSLSVGTDEVGRGMAVYVSDADGRAYEWNDTRQERLSLVNRSLGVTNNVMAVAAGQEGQVFVLTTDHHLTEFDTAWQRWTDIGGGIASVSASASRIEVLDYSFGTAMPQDVKSTTADVLKTDGTAWEWSQQWMQPSLPGSPIYNYLTPLANSRIGIANNVKSVSRAPTGESFILLTGDVLFEYDPASQAWSDLGANIASVSAGADAAGHAMAIYKTLDGIMWDWSTAHPWDSVHGYCQELFYPGQFLQPLDPMSVGPYSPWNHPRTYPPSKTVVSFTAGANGVSDVVLSDGSLYQYSDVTHQWTLLDTGAA
jgi:hypothetical protein